MRRYARWNYFGPQVADADADVDVDADADADADSRTQWSHDGGVQWKRSKIVTALRFPLEVFTDIQS